MRSLTFVCLLLCAAFSSEAQLQRRDNSVADIARAQRLLNEGVQQTEPPQTQTREKFVADKEDPPSNLADQFPMCKETAGTPEGAAVAERARPTKRGNADDMLARRGYLSLNVVNPKRVPMRYVVDPFGTMIKSLCQNGSAPLFYEKGMFSNKKGSTLQLMALDANGETYWSQVFEVGSRSSGFIWVIGENDARGPAPYWSHEVITAANRYGYNPELAIGQIEAEQQRGIAMTNGGYGGGGYGAGGYGYGMAAPIPCNPGGSRPGGIAARMGRPVDPCLDNRVGGAVWGGGAVMPGGVPYGNVAGYGYGYPPGYVPNGYDPYYEWLHGPGTSYRQQCGTIFAPATWGGVNPCGVNPYAMRGYNGYGRPGYIGGRAGVYGGIHFGINLGIRF